MQVNAFDMGRAAQCAKLAEQQQALAMSAIERGDGPGAVLWYEASERNRMALVQVLEWAKG